MIYPNFLFFDSLNLEFLHFTPETHLPVPFLYENWFYFYKNSILNFNFFLYNTEDIEFFSDNLQLFQNLENVTSLYHYSIPTVKLAYPEPFIASPSFMHNDLWFAHILIYQYWLWFVFVFIIVFFFVTFVGTVRWCNLRIRPRRETRGVSRSKCGDLITACVPVSWATSIIIHESVDAIDYFDGFGTTELVVGIRAYQWGWEYYYPKDIDLNYNIKKNYSTFVGNSLKYNKISAINLQTINMWKFYQNKTFDQIITPAHFLLIPLDNLKVLNFLNFNDLGANALVEMNAFKKIKNFSKIPNFDLINSESNFNSKFNMLSRCYFNENIFSDAHLYGLKRQHNFVSNKFINKTKILEKNSFNKFLNFSLNFNYDKETSSFYFNHDFKKLNSLFIFYLNKILEKYTLTNDGFFLNKYLNFFNFISYIQNNSDKKFPIYLNSKALVFLEEKNNFLNEKINLNFDFSNNFYSQNINNEKFNLNKKFLDVYSNNQTIRTSEKFIKKYINLKSSKSDLNLSNNLNSLQNLFSAITEQINPALIPFLFSNFGWKDSTLFIKLGTNKFFQDSPFNPITVNDENFTALNYDTTNNSFIENNPVIFQGKEDTLPLYLTSIYWNFYWTHSSLNWRLKNIHNFINITNVLYLPIFTFYYDYDFKNWQTLEFLEDNFWETNFNFTNVEEYSTIVKNFNEIEYINKINVLFFSKNKFFKLKEKIITKPIFIKKFKKSNYSHFAYFEENSLNLNYHNTNDMFSVSFLNNFLNIDDTYESLKYLKFNFADTTKNATVSNLPYFTPVSSSLIFDAFRSDLDEFSWFNDRKNSQITNNFLMLNQQENNLFNFYSEIENKIKTNRFQNSLNMRNTVKNSVVNFNALQKVYKSRLDEKRSHTKLETFAKSFEKQPFITSNRPNFEKLIGKSKFNFYKFNFYKFNFLNNFNIFYNTQTCLNYNIFDFPFLLAYKSDASRYLWLDWFAKWSFFEVQPSSASKYAIFGMPYFNKYFNFNSTTTDTLNETETYFLRLNRARRNYLSNWTYAPFFYLKNNVWFKNSLYFNNINNKNEIFKLKINLNLSNFYFNMKKPKLTLNSVFSPSISNLNSITRNTWRPSNHVSAYYYNVSNFVDILTKREYLYRELFTKSNKIINLPVNFTNSPQNNLIEQLKALFLFVDPNILTIEYSRDFYFNSLQFANFSFLQSLTNNNKFLSNFFFFFFKLHTSNSLTFNETLFKNQFRPLRKGINNMLRLHATGAIAMPIEIRLQILASSKDVIHSWAIPSAGIKIDCIPGYSSHKVMIFLVSGIFWGQCMEICGRYHHWMPIVVYFMKRDLFFLWCTHFVFLSGSNNPWTINDRQFVDYVRLVSYDKNSWISELLN